MPISFLTTALLIVLMYLGFLISTVGYDKIIQMLKQIQSMKEETKNE